MHERMTQEQSVGRVCVQGCNTFTFSPAVMEQLCFVDETEAAAADFEEAARRSLQHSLT